MSGPIELVEAAYDVRSSDQDYSQRLVDCATPLFQFGLGTTGYMWARDAKGGVHISGIAASEDLKDIVHSDRGPAALMDGINGSNKRDDFLFGSYLASGPSITLREGLGDRYEELAGSLGFDMFGDMLGLKAELPEGGGYILLRPAREKIKLGGPVRRRLEQLMPHVAAGLRLRRSLENVAGPLTEAPLVEAVLDDSGRTVHAVDTAREARARDVLRAAVLARRLARSRAGRARAETALDVWQGLVDGRWSLVDQLESDGRHYLVAIRNSPDVKDPRALSLRERQVAALASLGYSNKLIGYTLGIAKSSVATALKQAQRKLGVRSRAGLIALLAASGQSAPKAPT